MILSLLHIILGPTCSGKNALARHLAPKINAEIISVDSMKIYRGMNIGTAKPAGNPALMRDKHVITNITNPTNHLIDIIEPNQPYNAARFLQDCETAIAKIQAKGRLPLLVAGTPMYLKVLLYGMFTGPSQDANLRKELEELARAKGPEYLHSRLKSIDPAKAEQLHPNDLKRIIRAIEVHQLTGQPISAMQTHFKPVRTDNSPGGKEALRYPVRIIGLERNRAELYQRINDRVDRMFKDGLVDEVKGLLKKYGGLSPQAAQAVGYKEVIAHLSTVRSKTPEASAITPEAGWTSNGVNGRMSLAPLEPSIQTLRHATTLQKTPLTGLPETIDTVKKNTRHFARRQISWFHKFPDVKWIDVKESDTVAQVASKVMKEWE